PDFLRSLRLAKKKSALVSLLLPAPKISAKSSLVVFGIFFPQGGFVNTTSNISSSFLEANDRKSFSSITAALPPSIVDTRFLAIASAVSSMSNPETFDGRKPCSSALMRRFPDPQHGSQKTRSEQSSGKYSKNFSTTPGGV